MRRLCGPGRLPWLAVVTVLLAAGCTTTAVPGSPAAPTPAPGAIAASTPATVARIQDILADMGAYAFNPQAPPASGAGQPGGLFINWRGSWSGSLATAAANTDIKESGQSDQQAGSAPRHDPLTDLTYLVNLYAYQAVHPGDQEFAADITRMEPIVQQEYAGVGYYRCWVYFQLRDLGGLQPGQGWDALAASLAAVVYRHYYDSQAGTVADPRHDGTYRTDYAAECGAMLIDAGQRAHQAAWVSAGNSTLAHLLQRAQNPDTHLFPLQMRLGQAHDSVIQAQLTIGEEAQLLNAFLDAYDLTGNKDYLGAVVQAVNSMYDPATGLWDQVNGGFFFSVYADGQALNTSYKETRQAWMLPLLQHLARIEGGSWAGKENQMLTVVLDKLWQPGIHGYPYRVSPGFGIYQSHNGPGRQRVTEDWVTSEAMGIASEALVSQLLALTWLIASVCGRFVSGCECVRGSALMDAICRRFVSFLAATAGGVRTKRRITRCAPALALMLTLLPLLLVSRPAAAQGNGPLTLSTSSASAGQRVLLTGSGFTPGESVQPYWDYGTTSALAQKSFYLYNPIVTADSSGNVTADLFVPVVPSGPATISLVGLKSAVVDTASFTVVARIDTGAAIAPAGTALTFSGWDFGSRETVSVYWSGTLAAKASTDNKGSFSGKTFTVPSSAAPGSYAVTATGASSGITASATVTVGATPTGPAPGPDDWPNWGFDAQQHRVNTAETAFSTANIATLGAAWQASVPGPDKYQASPTVANGIVYIASVHGLLSAYNETSGALLWSYQARGPIYASPAIVNGVAYFGTVNEPQESQAGNYAIALNAQTGAVIWADPLPDGGDWATPLVASGEVVFPMANREGVSGGMIAFGAMTGNQLWYDQTNEGIWAPPTLDPSGQFFYQGTGNPCTGTGSSDSPPCSGQILTVNLATGAYTTLFQVPDLSGDDDIPAAPTYDNGNLYFGNKDGIFFSISATTGAINWQYNTGFSGDFGIYGSGAVYDGLVIFEGIGDKKVIALNESTGSPVWSYTTNGGPNSPVIADGMVFFTSYSGTFVALNAATGQLLWSTRLGAPTGASAVVANGMVFQPVGGGSLDAFELNGLAITSAASTSVTAGQPLSFTVTSAGPAAPSFTETGVLPAGVTFTDNGNGTATLAGTPALGQQGTYPITIAASAGPANTVTQSFVLTVNAAPAATDMSAGIAGPASTTAGSTVVYTATSYNLGPAAASQVTTTLTLPPGATFVSAQNGGTYANGTVTWTSSAIASGSHANFKVSVTLSNVGANTVTASVQAVNADPNPANNTASLTTTVKS
jgi:uncharacterized repeat protein (TIGR01451 family)